MITVLDYYSKQLLANISSKQLSAWANNNGYLIHSKNSRYALVFIK